MTTIFIRHARKFYNNGYNPDGYPAHDSPLCKGAEEETRVRTKNLIENYNIPEKIICSPFYRTRETALIMQYYILKNHNIFVDIEINNSISEFLGHQRPWGAKADLHLSTNDYIRTFIGRESISECKERIIKFYDSIEKNKNCWYVTHGILISFLREHLTGKKKKVRELEYFVPH